LVTLSAGHRTKKLAVRELLARDPFRGDTMLKNIFVATVATAAAVAYQSVAAQASAPMSREQVKSDTAAANKAGQLTPAGGGPAAPKSHSTKSRSHVKSETAAAAKAGELTPAGGGPAAPKTQSTKSRQQVKSETMDAKKKGELKPAGQ
jgi:hypothetical protein